MKCKKIKNSELGKVENYVKQVNSFGQTWIELVVAMATSKIVDNHGHTQLLYQNFRVG